MRNSIVFFAVLLTLPVTADSLLSASAPLERESDHARVADNAGDSSTDRQRDNYRQRNAPDIPDYEIVELYQSLSELPLWDQRNQVWSLSPKAKTALWTRNIQRYLDMHPALDTQAQSFLREVIRLAASPGFFAIEKGSPFYDQQQTILAEYMRRAEIVLPAEAIYEALFRLGAEPRSNSHVKSQKDGVSILSGDFCDCLYFYECGFSATCQPALCIVVNHCGLLNMQECTGLCKYEY